KVISVLQPEPVRRTRIAKSHFESQCQLNSDRASCIKDSRKRLAAHSKTSGRLRDSQPQRLNHKLLNNLARVSRVMHTHCDTSLVIIFVIHSFCFSAENWNVTLQLPLTFTAQVPFRLPFNSCSASPGKSMSSGPSA